MSGGTSYAPGDATSNETRGVVPGSARPPRNAALDALIAELSDLLAPAEDRLVHRGDDTRWPVLLVLGAPRCGSTLTTQWLAGSGAFAYPTNLLGRFSRTPSVGARIQLLLTDPRYGMRDELFDLGSGGATGGFSSDLGKTKGALAPSDFAFFWRRFLGTSEMRQLGAEGIAAADIEGLRASLAALESALGKPLAMKGKFIQFDLPLVMPRLPHAFLLHVVRDPVRNAASILESRVRYHGDRSVWYSMRPPGTERLLALGPAQQVTGQVLLTQRAVRDGLASVPEGRRLEVQYESLCARPAATWAELREKLAALGPDPGPYTGPASFQPTRGALDPALEAELVAAIASVAGVTRP